MDSPMSVTTTSPRLMKATPLCLDDTSPLTQLPVEIRLNIFHYVLEPYNSNEYAAAPNHHAPLTIHPADDDTPRNSPRRFWGSKQMASLLCLNRLIYAELHDLIYNNSHFVLDYGVSWATPATPTEKLALAPYVSRLSPDLARSIRHLDVRVLLYVRGLRDNALDMCRDVQTQFPALRSVSLRIVHISFPSNPLIDFVDKTIPPFLEAFRGIENIWLHFHETRFFGWGANNRTHIPGASPTGEYAKAKYDVVQSWMHFGLLPGGAMLYRSSLRKTNPKFEKLIDRDVFQKMHVKPRPSVLALGSIPDRELPGAEIAFKSARIDQEMKRVEARQRRRTVRF